MWRVRVLSNDYQVMYACHDLVFSPWSAYLHDVYYYNVSTLCEQTPLSTHFSANVDVYVDFIVTTVLMVIKVFQTFSFINVCILQSRKAPKLLDERYPPCFFHQMRKTL